jgi:hemolysin activation/secretion protein
VRGFDGETSLLGERGWLIRNDIGWAIGASGAELYAGIDYGHVGGPSARQLLGNHLAGAVIGVRGVWKGLGGDVSYDFFVGKPIAKPEGYRTARTTAGFNLNYSF